MCTIIVLVIWVSAGGYMLLFLAALQNIPEDVYEAAAIDGASPWRQIRSITIPLLRPTLFTVLTLGLIGTWQVFDQIYVMSKGDPGKTTLTPAFLAYDQSINNGQWGPGHGDVVRPLRDHHRAHRCSSRCVLRDRDASAGLVARFSPHADEHGGGPDA